MEDTIELLIKLPKGIYVASQMLNVKPDDVVQIPLEVIANGTPLQKGRGKIVDADVPAFIEADGVESEE